MSISGPILRAKGLRFSCPLNQSTEDTKQFQAADLEKDAKEVKATLAVEDPTDQAHKVPEETIEGFRPASSKDHTLPLLWQKRTPNQGIVDLGQ